MVAIHPPPIEVSINLNNCCGGLLAGYVKNDRPKLKEQLLAVKSGL